jgi:hypothetical protein
MCADTTKSAAVPARVTANRNVGFAQSLPAGVTDPFRRHPSLSLSLQVRSPAPIATHHDSPIVMAPLGNLAHSRGESDERKANGRRS